MTYYDNCECEICGEYSDGYPLCYDCYCEEQRRKNNAKKWGYYQDDHDERFYDNTKFYTLKEQVLNYNEMRFFKLARKTLPRELIITPQANLQSFVETDTYTRNDELFRNIDFVIFDEENYVPLLAIEINGEQHYMDYNCIRRDRSVKTILRLVRIPLITLDVEDLQEQTDEEISNIIKDIVNEYLQKETN